MKTAVTNKRKHTIIQFNLPYSANVKRNVVTALSKVIKKTFPKTSTLAKYPIRTPYCMNLHKKYGNYNIRPEGFKTFSKCIRL